MLDVALFAVGMVFLWVASRHPAIWPTVLVPLCAVGFMDALAKTLYQRYVFDRSLLIEPGKAVILKRGRIEREFVPAETEKIEMTRWADGMTYNSGLNGSYNPYPERMIFTMANGQTAQFFYSTRNATKPREALISAGFSVLKMQ